MNITEAILPDRKSPVVRYSPMRERYRYSQREIAKLGEIKVKNSIWHTSEADENIQFRRRK